MIHDFDMAVFLMGSMPQALMATGSVLTDKLIEALGDFDSASAVLRWADRRQMAKSPRHGRCDLNGARISARPKYSLLSSE